MKTINRLELFCALILLGGLIAGSISFFFDFKRSLAVSAYGLAVSAFVPIILSLGYLIGWGWGLRKMEGLPGWKVIVAIVLGGWYASIWLVFGWDGARDCLPFFGWWGINAIGGLLIMLINVAISHYLFNESLKRRRLAHYLEIPPAKIEWALKQPIIRRVKPSGIEFRKAYNAYSEAAPFSSEEKEAWDNLLSSCQSREEWLAALSCALPDSQQQAQVIRIIYQDFTD